MYDCSQSSLEDLSFSNLSISSLDSSCKIDSSITSAKFCEKEVCTTSSSSPTTAEPSSSIKTSGSSLFCSKSTVVPRSSTCKSSPPPGPTVFASRAK